MLGADHGGDGALRGPAQGVCPFLVGKEVAGFKNGCTGGVARGFRTARGGPDSARNHAVIFGHPVAHGFNGGDDLFFMLNIGLKGFEAFGFDL